MISRAVRDSKSSSPKSRSGVIAVTVRHVASQSSACTYARSRSSVCCVSRLARRSSALSSRSLSIARLLRVVLARVPGDAGERAPFGRGLAAEARVGAHHGLGDLPGNRETARVLRHLEQVLAVEDRDA